MLISLLMATQCSKLPSEEKSVLGNSAILKVLMVSSIKIRPWENDDQETCDVSSVVL